MPIDYSKWRDIEVSDDDDDTHPNIDTPSLFRWRHQARLERMAESKKEKETVSQELTSKQKQKAEIQQKLAAADLEESEKEKLRLELSEIEKQEETWRDKEADLEKKERLAAWNVDTISHDGFSKSRLNKMDTAKTAVELSEEEKEEKARKFIKDNRQLMEKYSMLSKWDDSKTFLLEHPHLCCEETANFLVIECLNHEMEEKHDLMEHVAHQSVVMQYLLELAKQLEVSPHAPQLISSFFSKIKMADKVYIDAFEDELQAFKERIRKRAKEKIEIAMQEYEEEERKKRLGPGGLDPQEIFESLPEKLKECFEKRDTQLLEDTLGAMPTEEAKMWLEKCIDSGLWVADAKKAEAESSAATDEAGSQDDPTPVEENITAKSDTVSEQDDPEIRQRKAPSKDS